MLFWFENLEEGMINDESDAITAEETNAESKECDVRD